MVVPVDRDKKASKIADAQPAQSTPRGGDMQEIYRKLEPELRRNRPNPDAIAAALEAAQRLAGEADAEQAVDDLARDLAAGAVPASAGGQCRACGYQNRGVSKFCAMCGSSMVGPEAATSQDEPQSARVLSITPNPYPAEMAHPEQGSQPLPQGTHFYHHHYHHHYFPGGHDGRGFDAGGMRGSEPARSDAKEDRMRPNVALRGDMSRAEAAVRRVSHEWVLACNTKHLDDLLELYAADAMVLRSNYPPVRGAAAVREFFFGALEAGLGEVELEPLRVEIIGDLAYEAGRCKALVPGATGKRREERGKYLWVCTRQSSGEWKLTADCWSSDLSLIMHESDVPQGAAVKTNHPRKNP
jgi:ketosteroid isomerase-like protein